MNEPLSRRVTMPSRLGTAATLGVAAFLHDAVREQQQTRDEGERDAADCPRDVRVARERVHGASVGRSSPARAWPPAARNVGELARETAQIALELGEPRATDAIVDEAPGLLRLHQPGLHQDFKVMAHRRLRQAERAFKVARADTVLDRATRGVGATQKLDDPDACRIAEGFEQLVDVTHGAIIYLRISICQYIWP